MNDLGMSFKISAAITIVILAMLSTAALGYSAIVKAAYADSTPKIYCGDDRCVFGNNQLSKDACEGGGLDCSNTKQQCELADIGDDSCKQREKVHKP